ncbi:hypothetical protein AK830_g5787 [Neonectria ditissima]|uniref:Transmembrane protein n=1 Tax=Neonectria ditissima TaxID=78410 RepID=A0A0P7BK57_9HYPO|nr:hypothetical protein AK830_g5787 [Neonectria ditissima]
MDHPSTEHHSPNPYTRCGFIVLGLVVLGFCVSVGWSTYQERRTTGPRAATQRSRTTVRVPRAEHPWLDAIREQERPEMDDRLDEVAETAAAEEVGGLGWRRERW